MKIHVHVVSVCARELEQARKRGERERGREWEDGAEREIKRKVKMSRKAEEQGRANRHTEHLALTLKQ